MWQRELEVLGEQLFDVWTADVVGLLHFDNLEDLKKSVLISIPVSLLSDSVDVLT